MSLGVLLVVVRRRSSDSPRSCSVMGSTLLAHCLSPLAAAERGYVDEVIAPRETRGRVARALALLRGKTVEMPARRHDNLPL